MKVSKENFGWIFSCVALGIALVISIILGYSGFYFKNTGSYVADLKLGDVIQLDMRKNQAGSISVNLDGSFLPGDKLDQEINIKNLEVEDEIYLRAKIYIYSAESKIINIGISPSANWKYNADDGYYYYSSPLAPQNKTNLSSYIVLDENDHLYSNKKYIVTLLAESFSDKTMAQNLWNIDFSTFFTEI